MLTRHQWILSTRIWQELFTSFAHVCDVLQAPPTAGPSMPVRFALPLAVHHRPPCPPPPPCLPPASRSVRRKYDGPAAELRDHLDREMRGVPGTFEQLPLCAKTGPHWVWKHWQLKGSVHFFEATGQVRVQGNPQQQTRLIDLLKSATGEWTGPVILPKKKVGLRRLRPCPCGPAPSP